MKIIRICSIALSLIGIASFFLGWYFTSIEQTVAIEGVQIMIWGFCALGISLPSWYLSVYMKIMSSVWIYFMIGILGLSSVGMIAVTIQIIQ